MNCDTPCEGSGLQKSSPNTLDPRPRIQTKHLIVAFGLYSSEKEVIKCIDYGKVLTQENNNTQ